MKVDLLNASDCLKLMKRLASESDSILVATAWAHESEARLFLRDYSEKVEKFYVGLSFFHTDASVLRDMIGLKFAKEISVKRGTFHPKMYLFKNGAVAHAIVGSSNLTRGGLGVNLEANLHISGDLGEEIFSDIISEIEAFGRYGNPVTAQFANSYELQQKAFKSRVQRTNPVTPASKKEWKSFASKLTQISWEDYSRRVRDDKNHVFEQRIALLQTVQSWLVSTSGMAALSVEQWKAIGGVIGSNGISDPEIIDHDWGWFGSMTGAGEFAHLIGARDKHLAKAMDCVPLSGSVTRQNFEEFRRHFLTAFKNASRKGGVATASRLLAMKRPDVFVCISNPNKTGLSDALNFAKTTLDLNNYWERVVDPVSVAAFYNAARPSGEDAKLWDFRAAMLDAIYYAP